MGPMGWGRWETPGKTGQGLKCPLVPSDNLLPQGLVQFCKRKVNYAELHTEAGLRLSAVCWFN